MLDKILNINPNSPYSGGANYQSGEEKGVRQNQVFQFNQKDKINFSPAAQFLSKSGWTNLIIDQTQKDKVSLKYSVSELEFYLEVDFRTLYLNERKNIKAARYFEQNDKVEIFFSVKLRTITLLEEPENRTLNSIKKVFDRIKVMGILNESEMINGVIYEALMDEIEYNVESEFEYIFSSVYSFLNKLKNFELINNYKFEPDDTPNIIIEKVLTGKTI